MTGSATDRRPTAGGESADVGIRRSTCESGAPLRRTAIGRGSGPVAGSVCPADQRRQPEVSPNAGSEMSGMT